MIKRKARALRTRANDDCNTQEFKRRAYSYRMIFEGFKTATL